MNQAVSTPIKLGLGMRIRPIKSFKIFTLLQLSLVADRVLPHAERDYVRGDEGDMRPPRAEPDRGRRHGSRGSQAVHASK